MRRSLNPLSWFCAIVILFLSHASAWAAPAIEGVTEVRHLEGITEYKLESNGLTILLAPDQSSPSVTVNMTYLVGSRHENYGQTGMAHLLEHMIFKGTPTVRNALAEFSKRGLQANGSTSQDRTNYFATFSADPEILDWYIRWQADAMVNSLILKEDLDSEMTVVRNEMESNENNPLYMLISKATSVAYDWHNYGKSTIGARSDVEGVDIEQLGDFYRQYYQPDNAVLIIAGKFDVDATLKIIADAFGKIQRPERTLPRQYTIEPVQDGERRITLRRTGGTPIALSVYHIPQGSHPDFAAIELATQILSDTPSGRLYKALVPTGLAASVAGGSWEQRDPGTAVFLARLTPEQDPEKALKVINEVVEGIQQNPFTEEELQRAKNQWLNSWEQMYSDMSRVGTLLSEYVALGDWRMMFRTRDLVKATVLEQVQKAAEQYFVTSNRTEGLYYPTDKPLRAPAFSNVDLENLLAGYEGQQDTTVTETFDTSPENIDKLTQRKILNLPTGPVKLALLPKESRSNRVDAVISVRFGDEKSLFGKDVVSSIAADMLSYGTSKMTRQEIEDAFESLQTQYSISGSGTTVNISLSSRKDTLPKAIELVLHLLKEPAYPQDQLDEVIRQSIAQLTAAKSEPEAVAAQAVGRYGNPWPKGDLRYVPTFDESIESLKAITRQDLIDFHKEFYGNGNILVSIVGSFETEPVEQVLTTELTNWKKAAAYERISNPYVALAPTVMTLETPDKANAFFLAKLPIEMQDTNPDFPALLVANYMFGQSHNSRLWMRIREKDGLSYGVGSYLDASAFEPSAQLRMYAIYAPENQSRLQQALTEEFERVMNEGFTQDELNTSIQGLLNLRALSRSKDSSLANAWLSLLNTNRTFAWAAKLDEQISKLTLDEVNAAFRKYVKFNQLIQAYAGDFTNKKAK